MTNALQLTANTLLRAFGATAIALRLPGVPTGDATAAQLGETAVPTEDVPLAPALVRPHGSSLLQHYEVLVSAIALSEAQQARGYTSPAALVNAAVAVVVNGAALRVLSFATDQVGATPVLHRIIVGS